MPFRPAGLAGLTLVELIIVVSLVAIVLGVVALVLRTGLSSWQFGESEALLQRETQLLLEEMIEGTDRIPGIREALEIIDATDTSLGLIPLWVDYYPEYKKDQRQFTLSKKFKSGAFMPIGQVRVRGSKEFMSVPVVFSQAKGESSNTVDFINPIPVGADVRVLFYPDPSDESVVMHYYWDKNLRRIFRVYQGKTEDIIRRNKKMKVSECKFSYYDNLNKELIPVYEGESVKISSSAGAGRANLSAIGIKVTMEQNKVKRELSSFVSARLLGGNLGSGIMLSKGTEVEIPDSAHIKALVLDNIGGIAEGDKLEIEIKPSSGSTWKMKMDFGIVNDEPYIMGFSVEYPLGSNVYTNTHQRPVKGGFNLLRFGDDYYDYDNDNNVNDVVNIISDHVVLKVVRMDLEAAALFVRP